MGANGIDAWGHIYSGPRPILFSLIPQLCQRNVATAVGTAVSVAPSLFKSSVAVESNATLARFDRGYGLLEGFVSFGCFMSQMRARECELC